MNLFQTKEAVSELSIKDAEGQLELLTKTYDLDKDISKSTPAQWIEYDHIANNLLWLEEHISYSRQVEHLNNIRHKESV